MDGGHRGTQDGRLLADLRAATRAQHAALDLALGAELARSTAAYARFLRASLAAAAPVEAAVERVLGPEFPALRSTALHADLTALAAGPSPAVATFSIASEAEGIGAAYVIEGSALGGLVLAGKVRAALGVDAPVRYLQLRGAETAARWRWFLQRLRDVDARWSEALVASATAAASRAFSVYAEAYGACQGAPS